MHTDSETKALISRILDFLTDIGISCRQAVLEHATFLPGLDIEQGTLLYDPERLLYPGDLLHEAGHLCMLLPEDRAKAQSPDQLSGDIDPGGAEMGAIAWSWAALQYLQLPPEVVFHPTGYHGGSDNIIENFSAGKYFGVSLLNWMGMTTEPRHATEDSVAVFPRMQHWLRGAQPA